jgi:GTP-binding protein
MKPIKPNLYKVVIVGRPKVGKSTLFNRVLKKRKAIVEKFGPTTRDRITAMVKWSGRLFELIDTAGLDFEKKTDIASIIERQILAGIREADQVIFVCDAMDGVMQLDYRIGALLRKSNKRIVLAVNKTDSKKSIDNMLDFYSLGLGDPLSISALHGKGIADLLDNIVLNMPEADIDTVRDYAVRLAIVGKPNAGKSSFVNSILGEERIVVSDIPGTTRDSIDTYFEKEGKPFILIDTAGIRSKRKIKDAVTYFSILRAEETVKKSDVAVMLLDAPLGITKEDYKIINLLQKYSKPFILAVNKWDLAEKNKITENEYESAIRATVRFIYNAPILFISALKGVNLMAVMDIAYELAEKSKKNFSTSGLNEILEGIDFSCTKLYSIRQLSNAPPEFEIVAKNPETIKAEHINYLSNIFRRELNLEGVPIIIRFRRKHFNNDE